MKKGKEQSWWDVWWSEVSLHLSQSLQSFISFLTVSSSTYHPVSGAVGCLSQCVYDEDEQMNVFSQRFNKRLTERCGCFNKGLRCFYFLLSWEERHFFSLIQNHEEKILTWWWMSDHVAPSAGNRQWWFSVGSSLPEAPIIPHMSFVPLTFITVKNSIRSDIPPKGERKSLADMMRRVTLCYRSEMVSGAFEKTEEKKRSTSNMESVCHHGKLFFKNSTYFLHKAFLITCKVK